MSVVLARPPAAAVATGARADAHVRIGAGVVLWAGLLLVAYWWVAASATSPGGRVR